jgi:phosphoribosylglycinamide formyltransferase 1
MEDLKKRPIDVSASDPVWPRSDHPQWSRSVSALLPIDDNVGYDGGVFPILQPRSSILHRPGIPVHKGSRIGGVGDFTRRHQGRPTMADVPRDPPMVNPPIRLAVCVSGGGTTLQNLIDLIRAKKLRAQLVQVIASKPRIGAIGKAEAAGIPLALANRQAKNVAEFSRSVFDPIRQSNADLVILGGFLALVDIPPDYQGRVLNIHPALIPAFCGKGMHGSAVHKAVIEAGVKVSGCTVHFADASYDTGPIILQRTVPVLEADTPDTLAARVFQVECQALPEAIALYADGRLKVDGRRVRVLNAL